MTVSVPLLGFAHLSENLHGLDGRLAQGVNSDPSAVDAVGVDAGGPSVSLDQSPRGLAVHVVPVLAQNPTLYLT
jgi:hypothetical protein